MDLSYAQHLEDFHLSRVFDEQREGFYIDVGAGHPVADNASCWFYLRGWRGVVVEPQSELLSLYEFVRPRDIREGRALGLVEGETDFHVVDRLHGFSTTIREYAELAEDFGAGHATRRTPATTHATLCAEHNVGAVDFLKIDGQFITDLLDDKLDAAAVRCFQEVANVVGVKTIAEFVEREDILAALQKIGVNMAQGYLVHRPEPISGMLKLLDTAAQV